jgi:hypothetical protein
METKCLFLGIVQGDNVSPTGKNLHLSLIFEDKLERQIGIPSSSMVTFKD